MNQDEERAQRLLQGAYALESPGDNREYYREFAPVYDQQFASEMGYCYPRMVAQEFLARYSHTEDAVMDIGCGTGLVAEELSVLKYIDGADISNEMLFQAREKQLYRALYCVDLTTGTGPIPCNYAGVVSAGTFTHGHLGPDVLVTLIDIGRAGALFCIGINSVHYRNAGFDEVLRQLIASGKITDYEQCCHQIFHAHNGDHSQDTATVVLFRTG